MISSRLGHDEVLNRLLAAGASIFIRDKTGYSAMGHAAEAGRVSTLKRLLDYGASALVHHLDGVSRYHNTCITCIALRVVSSYVMRNCNWLIIMDIYVYC